MKGTFDFVFGDKQTEKTLKSQVKKYSVVSELKYLTDWKIN